MPKRVDWVRFMREAARLRVSDCEGWFWKRGSRKRRSLALIWGVVGAESSSGGVALVK